MEYESKRDGTRQGTHEHECKRVCECTCECDCVCVPEPIHDCEKKDACEELRSTEPTMRIYHCNDPDENPILKKQASICSEACDKTAGEPLRQPDMALPFFYCPTDSHQ